jgi:endogenous inhibitor of DNA gyrase (YacG/DUF329 family)
MLFVMIKCPETGRTVNTGIALDLESFKHITLDNNSVRCPHCGKTHVWSKKDAFLREE